MQKCGSPLFDRDCRTFFVVTILPPVSLFCKNPLKFLENKLILELAFSQALDIKFLPTLSNYFGVNYHKLTARPSRRESAVTVMVPFAWNAEMLDT